MGSSYKRLALMGAAIAALIVSAAFFGATSSASAAKKSRLPSLTGRATSGSQSVRSHHLKAPKAPNVVLYDQYDNDSLNATSSQNFEADFDAFDDETADDFVVPGGETWNINQVDAGGQYFNGPGPMISANVSFYADAGGLPGSQVATRPNMTVVDSGGSIVIAIPSAVTLGSGHYWVSVQANMDFAVGGQWGFEDRLVQSNAEAAWQNPGGGFGVCPTWGGRNSTCGIDPGVPDQVFRLSGTTGGGGPSCSGGPITINDDGPATPYPSTCVVSGLSGEINDVNLTFTGLNHTYPDDIDMLLVSPDGDNATIMSDTGGSTDLVGCDLTLDDQAAQALPDFDPIVCPGSYQPADYEAGDPFPAPAPTPSGNVNLSTFNGGTANGTWSLYVVDDAGARRRQHRRLVAERLGRRPATTSASATASGLADPCAYARGLLRRSDERRCERGVHRRWLFVHQRPDHG